MTESVFTSKSDFYNLFSNVFLTGPVGLVQARARDIPRLRGVLVVDTDDELAAEHETMFGFNVFPFASLYLESDGMLGGQTTHQIRAFISRLEIDVGQNVNAPDHVATELRILATLAKGNSRGEESSAESDRESAKKSITELTAELTAEFIDRHLFSWLPSFVAAVHEESHSFYSELVDLMLEQIVAHRQTVAAGSQINRLDPKSNEHILSDVHTGIHDIAEFLISPPRCGFFLSRSNIAGIAHGSNLPHGFGGRGQMMATSLRSAAAYDGLDYVVSAIGKVIDRNLAVWRNLSESGLESGQKWSDHWQARLNQSKNMLEQMAGAIRRAVSE